MSAEQPAATAAAPPTTTLSAEQQAAATAAPLATTLPERRPTISHPEALSSAALADARRNQPGRGLIGLIFVLPLTALLSLAADGPTHSLIVLGPIITFGLPFVSAIAFWWQDWPGSMLPRPWSGLYDTLIIAVGGALMTMLGQVIVTGRTSSASLRPDPATSARFPPPCRSAAACSRSSCSSPWSGNAGR